MSDGGTLPKWHLRVIDYIGLGCILVAPEEFHRDYKAWYSWGGFLVAGIACLWFGEVAPTTWNRLKATWRAPKALAVALADLARLSAENEELKKKRTVESAAPAPPSSKLKVISAEFRAFADGGDKPDVTEVLNHKIVGDGLVFRVDRGDFKAAGLDPVSRDPFEGKIKRVEVTYSYRNEPPVTTECIENDLLVLPEDIQFLPLQRHALRLSVKLLEFLNRAGSPPVPRYTKEQISAMPLAMSRKLLEANDRDYDYACEYHFGNDDSTLLTPEQSKAIMVSRVMELNPWYGKVRASFVQDGLQQRLELLQNLLAIQGLREPGLYLDVAGRNIAGNIRTIARTLWELAYRIGERKGQNA